MKKIFVFLLTIFTIFSLTGCKKTPQETNAPTNGGTPEKTVTKTYESLDPNYLTGNYNLAQNIQDGVILHAWNWSYDTIKDNLLNIAEAGFSTVQTSPVQQPKGYNGSLELSIYAD